MPGLLRPRLSCFYCGSRSTHIKDGKTLQFTCKVCQATNHLDKNGDITDPPTTPAIPQTQVFAYPRATSPTPPSIDDDLFCKICIKNQHFLTTCLAEYLPDENHPEYDKYERQYPQYRKDLERRYPQVCQQCAPRVQERIRKTGYEAKVDFLTRNIERSKHQPLAETSIKTSLAILLVNITGVAWTVCMLVQAAWHALGLLGLPADQVERGNVSPLDTIGCLAGAAKYRFLLRGCAYLFVDAVALSLKLSLFTIWWNPALKTKLRLPGRNYQWIGLADFYKFQFVVLFMRVAVWWELSSWASLSYPTDINRAFHGCALIVIILGTIAPHRIVNYVPVQRISFKDTTGPLVEPDDFQYPLDISAQQLSGHPVANLRQTPTRPFDINNLGSRRTLPNPTSPAGPPTPPESDTDIISQLDDTDSMDWEPLPHQPSQLLRRTQNPTVPLSTSSFPPLQPTSNSAIPAFLRPPATASTGGKSPFTGRLPPAPISPAHRLRNPPARPSFKPTPLSKQQDFFKQMGLSTAALDSKHRPQNTTSHRRRRSSGAESSDTVTSTSATTYIRTETEENDPFRPAQWTLASDLDAAIRGTGTDLEDMFSSSFKLGDDTPGNTPGRRRQTQQQQRAREVGGDGREIFDRKKNKVDEARATWWTMMGRGGLWGSLLPLGLALLALGVALLRDPGARREVWTFISGILETVVWSRGEHQQMQQQQQQQQRQEGGFDTPTRIRPPTINNLD